MHSTYFCVGCIKIFYLDVNYFKYMSIYTISNIDNQSTKVYNHSMEEDYEET